MLYFRYTRYTIPIGVTLSVLLVAAILLATALSGKKKEKEKKEEIEIPPVGIDNKGAEILSPNLVRPKRSVSRKMFYQVGQGWLCHRTYFLKHPLFDCLNLSCDVVISVVTALYFSQK